MAVPELFLTRKHIEDMKAHVQACAPEEGCGLLVGKHKTVKTVIPVTNDLHSPVRYNMDPNELISAFYKLEEQDLELLATFHSHPDGPLHPSETDLQEYQYPEAFMLILDGEARRWSIRGFKIKKTSYEEIRISEMRNH